MINLKKEKELIKLHNSGKQTTSIDYYGFELMKKYPSYFNLEKISEKLHYKYDKEILRRMLTPDIMNVFFDNVDKFPIYYYLISDIGNNDWKKYLDKIDFRRIFTTGNIQCSNRFIRYIINNKNLKKEIISYELLTDILMGQKSLTVPLIKQIERISKKIKNKITHSQLIFYLSMNRHLSINILREYKDELNWTTISRNRIKFSNKVKKEFNNYINWRVYKNYTKSDLEKYFIPNVIKDKIIINNFYVPDKLITYKFLVNHEKELLTLDNGKAFLLNLLVKTNKIKLTPAIKEFLILESRKHSLGYSLCEFQQMHFTDKEIMENIDLFRFFFMKRLDKIKNKNLRLLIKLKGLDKNEWQF